MNRSKTTTPDQLDNDDGQMLLALGRNPRAVSTKINKACVAAAGCRRANLESAPCRWWQGSDASSIHPPPEAAIYDRFRFQHILPRCRRYAEVTWWYRDLKGDWGGKSNKLRSSWPLWRNLRILAQHSKGQFANHYCETMLLDYNPLLLMYEMHSMGKNCLQL